MEGGRLFFIKCVYTRRTFNGRTMDDVALFSTSFRIQKGDAAVRWKTVVESGGRSGFFSF